MVIYGRSEMSRINAHARTPYQEQVNNLRTDQALVERLFNVTVSDSQTKREHCGCS